MLIGHWRRKSAPLLRAADKGSLYAIYALLFLLGARLGSDASLLAQLPLLGGRALCICLCCTAGSVLCLAPLERLFPAPPERRQTAAAVAAPSPLWGSARIIGCFCMGILLATVSLLPVWVTQKGLAAYALYLLVFAVGIGLGADLRAFGVVRLLHVRIIAVPLLITAGTALGAVAACFLLPGVSLRDALCVGAGLGYYSLSSILIENAGNAALASVALLANILREVLSIFAAPLLVRYCGRLSPIGAAGATAMDSALPVIARFSGEHCAVIAVFSGMALTLLAPFLVTAALQW